MYGEPGSFVIVRRPGAVAGISLRKRRCWYEGEQPSEQTQGTDTTQQSGQGSGQSTGTSAGQSGGQSSPETFSLTASQLAERLNRAEQSAINKVYEGLGVKNSDELKAMLDDYRKRTDGEKSELEKVTAKATKLEAEAKEAKDRATQMEQERRLEKRNNAILKALDEAEHPLDVLIWLEANAKSEVEAALADDGTLDEKKVKALVDRAKKDRPNFFKKLTPGSPSNRGGRVPDPTTRDLEQARAHVRAQVRKSL